jgi:hypothetical protein
MLEGRDPLPVEWDTEWAQESVFTLVKRKIYGYCRKSNHDSTVVYPVT